MKSSSCLIMSGLLLCLTACANLSTTQQPVTVMPAKTSTIHSNYSYQETIARLQNAIENKGMVIFGTIDHEAAAKQYGLTMQPATVIIYGNPKAGTPLMIKDPEFALNLPLKVLVSEINGKTQVSYTPSQSLIEGSQIEFDDIANTLANAEKLIIATVK